MEILIKRGKCHVKSDTERGVHVTTEIEIGVMHL